MTGKTSDIIAHGFLLDSDAIKKLYVFFETKIGEYLAVQAKCRDDIERSFETKNDLLKYANNKSSEIVSLSFYGAAANGQKKLYLCFETDKTWQISYSLEGKDEQVIKLRRELFDMLATFQPWYDRIHVNHLPIVVLMLYPMLLTAINLMKLIGAISNKAINANNQEPLHSLAESINNISVEIISLSVVCFMVHPDLARTQLPNWFNDCLDGCVEPTWGRYQRPQFPPPNPHLLPSSLFRSSPESQVRHDGARENRMSLFYFYTCRHLRLYQTSFFPRSLFLIGNGVQRYQNFEKVQQIVVIASIVSFATGAILMLIQSALGL